MRPVRLARIAAEAEGLRWRHRARKLATQIVLAIVALPFLLAAFAFLEIAFWKFVVRHFQPEEAALLVVGGNLLVALLLLGLASMRGNEDRVSLEALEVRRRALESAQTSLSYAALIAPITGFLLSQLRRPRRRRDD
ncbi:MAG: hypothetical protein ABI369_03275 [Acetobacteraceae bacterium]